MDFLFPCEPLNIKAFDPDFLYEVDAVNKLNLRTHKFDFEEFA